MRKLLSIVIILTVLLLTLSGCGTAGSKEQNSKEKEILSQLNTMKEENKKPKEMFDYLNQNIKELKQAAATEGVGVLVNVMEEYEATYNEQLFTENYPDLMFKYFEFKFDYSNIEGIKEDALKSLLYDITLGGFKIVEVEGTFMVIVDYDALKTFNDYVDEELKTYIEILALRYNNPIAIDASILIKPEELEKRIMQMEGYIKSFNNQQRKEMMISMYQGYMMVYMSGTDNTPVFDYDTGVIDPKMFKEFEGAASRQQDTMFGSVMNKYIQLLKQEGFMNTEKVQDFILNLDTHVNEELSKVEKK